MVRTDRGWRLPVAMALLGAVAVPAGAGEPAECARRTVSEIAAASAPAIVMLRVRAVGGREWHLGTGFLIDSGGAVVTALHLVDGAEKLQVKSSDGERYRPTALRAFDPGSDLAVLQIDAGELPALELGDSSEIDTGDAVVVIGNPLGLTRTVTEGLVSAWREPLPRPEEMDPEELEEDEEFGERRRVRVLPNIRTLQISAQIGPGTSGAPVFDLCGRVIGMAVAYGPVGLNFAVPAERITPLLEVDEGLTLASFRRRVELARQDQAHPHVAGARLALELERHAEARREIDAALQLDPHSAEALLLEAELLRRQGDLARAEEALLHLTGRHPDSAEAWLGLGELYLQLDGGSGHALAPARQSLEKAMELDEELAPAARDLGVIAYRQGRYLSAMRLLQHSQELEDEVPETALWLGEVYLRLGRAGAARAAFESALELDADDPRAHHGLARTCVTLGHDASGREHWRRFLDLSEGDPGFEAVRERTVLYLQRYPHLIPLEYDHLLRSGNPTVPPS